MADSSPPAPKVARALAIVFVLIAIGTAVGFILDLRPPVASEHGKGIDSVITYLLVTTGAIFVAGHLILGWLLVKSSGKDSGGYKPESRKLEWMWAAVPLILFTVIAEIGVIALGSKVWTQLYGEPPADATQIELVARQFEWLVRYPGKDDKFGNVEPKLVREPRNPLGLDKKDEAAIDDVFVRGELRLPLGRPIVIRLRSHDVLHSFAVPQFRVKHDVVPGFTARIQFRPTKVGKYEIACAELCGLGHYRMRAMAIVMEPDEYDKWLAGQRGWFQ